MALASRCRLNPTLNGSFFSGGERGKGGCEEGVGLVKCQVVDVVLRALWHQQISPQLRWAIKINCMHKTAIEKININYRGHSQINIYCKAHIFHWILGSRWPPNANEIDTKKHEMYLANARNLCLVPNATYIPLTCVWVSRRG